MDKARFTRQSLFSSALNRRRLLSRIAPAGAAGALLGTFAPMTQAQEQQDRYRKCVVVEPPTGSTFTLAPNQTMQLANLTGAGTVDLIQLGLGPINPPGPGDAGA